MWASGDELDVGLCVSSGQVFRWQREGDVWTGVDGSNVISARALDGGWEIESMPDTKAAERFFQLAVNLQDRNVEIARRAPELSPYLASHAGLRTLRCARADETLFSFLCTPNNHLTRIARMVNELATYGRKISGDKYEFPTIERLAWVDEGELRAKGFGYRAKTITTVAQRLAPDGWGWLERLRKTDYKTARTELCTLPGVGLKVADCVCLFGLHHEEAVPIDTHLWQAACGLYFPEWSGQSLTESRYRAVGDLFRDKFGKLAGWAHQYLFYQRVLAYRRGKMPG